jgi:hypothetical protein
MFAELQYMAKTTLAKKKSEEKTVIPPSAKLAEVVMVYMKASSHWYALVGPEIVTVEGVKFIAGKQVTGKEGHRMEGRRTLIPFEHVASLIEFAAEDELWSEPQPKHLPPPQDLSQQSVPLTSHEQPNNHNRPPQGGQGGHHRGRRHRKNRDHQGQGSDARFQSEYDFSRDRGGFGR